MDMDITFRSDMDVELVDSMGSDLSVAQAAWVSTQGAAVEDFAAGNTERAEGLIRFLMRGRHGTPFEHNSLTFLVRAPIFVWREHHRHRIGFSYNEESGRYSQLKPEFYVPADDRGMKQVGKPGAYKYVPDEAMASRVRRRSHETRARVRALPGLAEREASLARSRGWCCRSTSTRRAS